MKRACCVVCIVGCRCERGGVRDGLSTIGTTGARGLNDGTVQQSKAWAKELYHWSVW